ncbi:MAG: family 78 glycoside hydrolase catalytic domain [Clostridia bacterium]|nr:family 78 glycoside hydrolase catalytic domain [Clostridia bacterium]
MLNNAKWISYPTMPSGYEAINLKKDFCTNDVKKATLKITSLGCYYATINDKRVGDFILAPGCTSVKRVQMQTYDVTKLLDTNNTIIVTLALDWFKGRINSKNTLEKPDWYQALICELEITHKNGEKEFIYSDKSWLASMSKVRFADIYDGEHYDALFNEEYVPCAEFDYPREMIVNQQGEKIVEHEVIAPHKIFKTPKGETVLDFNQNLTGYFEFKVNAKAGDKVSFSFAEVLDSDGNFYTENYRTAKSEFEYICKDGENVYKPRLTFYGFRYIRVNAFPCEITEKSINAIVLHSDIKRTGYLNSSSPLLNKLFSNIIWGQKGNFLDIPTDCPQRDERMGWTGDAQVFIRTATYNYDVERFFEKWLRDMRLDQFKDGSLPHVVPQYWSDEKPSAAWGDAITICPYQIYLTYGNKKILKEMYPGMCKYVAFMGRDSDRKYLWTGGVHHFGDWLGMDAPAGSYKGSSRMDYIASVFYYYSTVLTVKVGKILGKNVAKYEKLAANILKAIRKTFTEYTTQTECVLALYFGIAEDKKATADKLAKMIKDNGTRLQTGFVGTPYLLHALSQNGYSELAYDLLLQEAFPSWLYSVKQGATTIWEHWDGVNDKGEFWSKDMNSFNHYAYGSVADWVYGVGCGIQTVEDKPGFEEIVIAPVPTKKLDHLSAKIETRQGLVSSAWYKEGESFRYEITTPVNATIIIDGKTYNVTKGSYVF